MHGLKLRFTLPSSAFFLTMLVYSYYQAWS